MGNFLWTALYIAVGIWFISRVIAYIIQWLLKRYLDVTLRFGKVGFLNFGKVQMTLHRDVSVHVELEKIWLSSSLFNPEMRKPIVMCIEDLRIQVDISNHVNRVPQARAAPDDTDAQQEPGERSQRLSKIINKLMLFGSYGGVRIQNVTVMLLKTMVPDCLIHFTSPEISLDISAAYDRYELCTRLNNFGCKALRSSADVEETSPPQTCLAEFSFTFKLDAKVVKADPIKLLDLKTEIAKPQMMITEGFLQSLQTINTRRLSIHEDVDWGIINYDKEEDELRHWPTDSTVSKLRLLDKLQQVSFDISDLDVKIVRETKQRSLAVSLKLFHLGFHNQSFLRATDVSWNVYMEEFNTSSMQAKFAGVAKVGVKSQLLRDSVDMLVTVTSGFFHYHHEEVQYWVLVFTNIVRQTKRPPQTQQTLHRTKSVPSPTLLSWVEGRSFSTNFEAIDLSTTVSSVACSGLHSQLAQLKVNANLKPGSSAEEGADWFSSYNLICEADIQSLSCCVVDAKIENPTGGNKHHWGQVLYLGLLLMKVKKFGRDVKVEGMKDNFQLEWSTSLYTTLSQLMGAVRRARPMQPSVAPQQATQAVTEDPPLPVRPSVGSAERRRGSRGVLRGSLFHTVKFDISNINVFVTNAVGVSVMLRVDTVSISHSPVQTHLAIDGTKVQYIVCQKESLTLKRSTDLKNPVVHISQVKVKYSPANKECRVHVLQNLNIHWSKAVHMCLISGIQDLKTLQGKFSNSDAGDVSPISPVLSEATASPSKKSSISINILVLADISFEAKLSEEHTISMFTQNLLVTMIPDILMEVKDLVIKCDGHGIFSIVGFQLETLPISHLKSEREQAKILESLTNKAWSASFESIDIVFPHQYNFALCHHELLNTIKWLKLVHKVTKKPFTVDSPLPPDLSIKVKMLSIELSDDPFEVKMGLNYELLKDEGNESKKRKEMMDAKLLDLQKRQFIPMSKREELFATLHKKSSEIYIQRSRQLYAAGPVRTQLFTWLMEDLNITALADRALHGKENVLKHMRDMDPESPFPKEPMEFSTLWCRYVNASVKQWSVSLRDFPRPMVDIQSKHVWGRLIGAEREGTPRARRTCTVEVGEPWETVTVERNLPPLKFFHDFSCDMTSFTLAYGVCWEPAVALFNLNMNLINKPSVDPSRPLPFWDKMRLLFHGRLTMSISQMSWLYHASFDPYNNTELMDWTWTNLVLDWTNAQFVLQGDLDISVRTASKYNESKLLHLPNLTFRVGIEWLCRGDANDHHSVMPCAPDKVPDFSLEEHDSFRAFRSQNLNLDLSLKTRPVLDTLSDIPSCPELYASTLRFLEKIKNCMFKVTTRCEENCMFSVTRPVRRGKYFGVTSPRRPQLTRHYKKIKLSVDFHKFTICHWMSNAKENGAELVADSFQLQMCNRLNLVPWDDGLLHRPRADWSIKYLKCHLGPTRIYLCKNKDKEDLAATANTSAEPADRCFFLSVSKISYQRADQSKAKKDEKNEQRTPTHSVSIYEMKGSWNQFNRMVVIGLYDSYMRAKSLRRNLSSEALKGFRVDTTATSSNQKSRSFSLSGADLDAASASGTLPSDPVTPSPVSKLQMGHAHSMLMKLVSESGSKSVAFTEEPSDTNVEQLHGIRACKLTDIIQTNWHIELHNSQVIVRGCETPGYVIVSAARAKIQSYTHNPIWRQGQLRSKSTWNGDVDCMQYYATVDPNNTFDRDNIPWLSRENVEDRANADLSGLPEMIGSGQSVGSVVSSVVPSASEQTASGDTVQLQRIIYRCSCQFFYANYGDVDPNSLPEVPLPPADDSDVMSEEEGVDTFTLLHESVYAYSNPLQFSVIMDIVNNLLLYTEPKKKEASDRLQSMRFKHQLYREDDQKTPILQLQEALREKVQELRQLEKDYYIAKTRDDEERMEMLEMDMEDLKNWITLKNEELSMRISCYNESQLQVKAQMKMEKAQQARVVRRNEVCFKYAKWRMTERDGHCGIAELELRNFVYSKVNRDDDSWTHLLELNWVKVENLLADNYYQKVLVPRDPQSQEGENRQMALRITCTERPPVGGISVKEHFEVNVAPIQIQMTYQFYKAVMEFFFPDKNVDIDDEDELEGKQKKEKKNTKRDREKRRGEELEKNSLRSGASFSSADDINKMRERAAKNNTFLYIKIPEVIAKVSYKGQKEKNIEDVHDFSFILHTVEYHNCIWTWFDFLITIKNHSKRVLLSQAIKQKLHWKAREEPPHTDVQEEEDKAKMLLGAKLLAGQEKPAKKGFFSKLPKS